VDYSDYFDFLNEHLSHVPKNSDSVATAFYELGIRASREFPGDLIVHYVRKKLAAPFDVRIVPAIGPNRVLISKGAQTFQSILPESMVECVRRFHEGDYTELSL